MTRREAIEALKYLISGECTDTQMDYVDEIEMAITDMKICEANNAGWISVKDRLPEHGKRYLIYATSEGGKNHRITTAAYGGHFALSGRCAYWKVTHWMPLPESPKEEL